MTGSRRPEVELTSAARRVFRPEYEKIAKSWWPHELKRKDHMGYWVVVDADTVGGKPSDAVTFDAAGGRLAEAKLSPSMFVRGDFTDVRVTVYAEADEALEAANIALPAVMDAFASVGAPMVFCGVTVQTEAEWERINLSEDQPGVGGL